MNRIPTNRTSMHSCSPRLFKVTVMADAVSPQISTRGAEDAELGEWKEKPVVAAGLAVLILGLYL